MYRIWIAMKARCYNQNVACYKDYGGRGITVCDEWRDSFEAFRAWSESNGYEEVLEIERCNNDGPYAPWNCRWATRIEQARNTRRTVHIDFNGERRSVAEWADITGINKYTLYSRAEAGIEPEFILTKGRLKDGTLTRRV